MNVHTSRNPAINPTLFVAPATRQRVWTDRRGHLSNRAVPVIPQKSSVSWEAYVVDVETNQAVTEYPVQKDTTVLAISNGARPTEGIVQMYLNSVRGQVSDELFHKLSTELSHQSWTIATIVHNTQPLAS